MKICNALHYLGKHGLERTMSYGTLYISEKWNERYFSINTSGTIDLSAFGINNPECIPYIPISYSGFRTVIQHIRIQPEKDVFVDYGAGKGRVVTLAATYPFQKVIGVELAPELVSICLENLRRAKKRIKCQSIEIIIGDACQWSLPDDATVLHLYNPFVGEILRKVAQKISESLQKVPRRLVILFGNADHFEQILRSDNSIPNHWITSRQDVLWPYYRQSEKYPDSNRYRIYTVYPQNKS